VARVSRQRGHEQVDLALLTDGLRAEREQGITIDVAYRYFATPQRKFIVADTPGHIQYTRNMVTGASTANLAIVLVDARTGVIEQTCRHSFIASLLRIEHVVVAVNKMDLVDWSEERFSRIVADYKTFASRLHIPEIVFIPMSALRGDNVVERSEHMPWYRGHTLLHHLETVYIGSDANHVDARFPVQYVIRPQSAEWHDFRGYAGRVAGGVFKPGDEVVALPSGFTSRITSIHNAEDRMDEAFYPHSCLMTLEHDIDVSRGDMLVKPHNKPRVTQDIEAMICWFSAGRQLNVGDRFSLLHTTREVTAMVTAIPYKVNVNTLHKSEDGGPVSLNEIARVHLRVSSPLFVDDYSRNRITGSLVLVHPYTHETVAGGMIRTMS
jgi:sulfate adenylyltransferase subunit 1